MGNWNVFDKFLARRRLAQILMRIPPNASVCDIGCGPGGALLFSIRNRIRKGIGIDRRVDSVKDDKIELMNADIDGKRLPLEDNSVDCVIFLAVLEHLREPQKTIAEIRRILAKGGVLVMTTPAPASKPVLESLSSVGILDRDEIMDHKKYWNKGEIESLLRASGFSEVDFSYFQFGLNQRAVAK